MLYTLDIGGSAVKTGIVSDDGQLIEKGNFSVPNSFKGMIEAIVKEVEKLQLKYEIEGIAISAPGSVDTSSGIIYGSSAIPYIHGPNWIEAVHQATGYPCTIENDANCAALAEAYYGSGKDKNQLAFVVIGSGIGGALVYHKEILHGAHLHGGEIGYSIVGERNQKLLSFSDAGSIGGLLRNCISRGLDVHNGKEVFALAEEGNAIAIEEIDNFYHYLAIGIFNVQYTYDPEIILLAGAISARDGLVDRLEKEIDYIMSVHQAAKLRPKIALASFRNDSNLIGAYVNYRLKMNKRRIL